VRALKSLTEWCCRIATRSVERIVPFFALIGIASTQYGPSPQIGLQKESVSHGRGSWSDNMGTVAVMECNFVQLVAVLQYNSDRFGLVPGIALQTLSPVSSFWLVG
jgi:hypothetical protein